MSGCGWRDLGPAAMTAERARLDPLLACVLDSIGRLSVEVSTGIYGATWRAGVVECLDAFHARLSRDGEHAVAAVYVLYRDGCEWTTDVHVGGGEVTPSSVPWGELRGGLESGGADIVFLMGVRRGSEDEDRRGSEDEDRRKDWFIAQEKEDAIAVGDARELQQASDELCEHAHYTCFLALLALADLAIEEGNTSPDMFDVLDRMVSMVRYLREPSNVWAERSQLLLLRLAIPFAVLAL